MSKNEAPKKNKSPSKSEAPAARVRARDSSEIDPRKFLLASLAGNIASGVLTAPSDSASTAEAIAEISVDIAEAILLKIDL